MNSGLMVRGVTARGRDTPVVRGNSWLFTLFIAAFVLASCSSDSGDAAPDDAQSEPSSGIEPSDSMDDEAVVVQADAGGRSDDRIIVGRTNVQASGNRYLPGTRDLANTPASIDLPFVAVWVLPLTDGSLVIVGEDGTAAVIGPDETVTELDPVDPTVRPLAFQDGDAIVLVPASEGVDSDVPDATEVQDGGTRAWFDGATERVPHGALGDTIESTRLVVVQRVVSDPMDDSGDPLVGGERVVVDLEDDPTQPVFEGLSPLLADVDGDGTVDILTTISDSDTGARLVVFNLSGERIAESEPIGQGNRWRHQIAVAPTNPNGGIDEVIEVVTPHIGGALQFRRFGDGGLGLQFQTSAFNSHELGSRNLDGAVVFDADGDGQPEAVVPVQDRTAIAVVDSEPADGGPTLIDLGGATAVSNLALVDTEAGLQFAVALSDGRLLVWRP